MGQLLLSLEDQCVLIRYPDDLQHDLRGLLGHGSRAVGASPTQTIVVERDAGDEDRYALQVNGGNRLTGLDKGYCLYALLCEVGQSLLDDLKTGVAFHAGAVGRRNLGIVVPGESGCGKSSLIAWFLERGFEYLSDELVVFGQGHRYFTAFKRPIILRDGVRSQTSMFAALAGAPTVIAGSNTIVAPSRNMKSSNRHECRLLIFPRFADGERLTMEALSPAEAGLELMACNVNARNLPNHGFDMVTSIAQSVPAIRIRYGSFEILNGALDDFVNLVLENDWNARSFSAMFRSFGNTSLPTIEKSSLPSVSAIPAPTPRREAKKLSIGMATYDDYDGVYFSLQALRMYHPEILGDTEFLVVDNNPTGRCAQQLKALENSIPNYRYVPYRDRGGTTVREIVFSESNAELVLCMDCHVFVVPGAVRKLIAYSNDHPDSKDLLQGPLIYDNLETISTHLGPQWRNGMYGCWATDARGNDPDAEPFDITMQGLGLFACRRSAWPGFNDLFRGFGGEEGYLHEKFRQAGGRVLCLPFLRWMHRFQRPLGIPYVNTWEDRIRNYFIGFGEVGWDTQPVEEHFSELLGAATAGPMIARIKTEIERLGKGPA